MLVLMVIGVVLAVGAAAAGAVLFMAARAAVRGGRQAKELLAGKAAALGAGDSGEAERLRLRLRQQVMHTRRAIDEAGQRGWQVGELPARVREVADMAGRLDDQLAVYAKARRGATGPGDPEALAALRRSAAKLIDACDDMRSALLRSDVDLQQQELDEVVTRAQIEAESLRAPGPLDAPRPAPRPAPGPAPRPELGDDSTAG